MNERIAQLALESVFLSVTKFIRGEMDGLDTDRWVSLFNYYKGQLDVIYMITIPDTIGYKECERLRKELADKRVNMIGY